MGKSSGCLELAFHYLWYVVVLPVVGSFLLALLKYRRDTELELVVSLGSALLGGLVASFFLLVATLLLATLLVPVLASGRRWLALGANAVGFPLLVIVVVPWKDPEFSKDRFWIGVIVAALTLLTCYVYDRACQPAQPKTPNDRTIEVED